MEKLLEQLKHSLTENLGTKIVSFLIALILWIVVLGSRSVEVSKDVPLEIITPSDLVVANEVPEKLSFRLSGPKAFLRSVVDRKEEPIRVNLIGNKPGLVTYRFFSDHIRLPLGVRVLSVTPPSVLIKLEPMKKREVPIQILTEGALPTGLKLKSLVAIPERVTIQGPESKVDSVREVPSFPVKLPSIRSSLDRELPLDLGRFGVQLEGPAPQLHIAIEGQSANFRIRNIEVQVLSEHQSRVEPAMVSALVHASPEDLKKINRTKIYATVDLRNRAKGTYRVAPQVILPEGVDAVRVIPEQVQLTLY
ncbi:MAG: hypothetical protein RJB38_1611 [Pseudomonadota bacterium]